MPARRGGMSATQKAIAAAVAAIAVLSLIWTARDPAITNLDSAGASIVAFGDSLTAGYGAREGEDYPSRLAAAIGADIINAGVSGDTTADALARIDADVLANAPRIVLVGLGGNDFLRGVPIATTEANLREIIRRIHDRDAMVLLLGFDFPSLSANYADMYEEIAADTGSLLVPDILAGMLRDPKLKSDDIHPNAAGYALMAERISTPLSGLIDKADAAR